MLLYNVNKNIITDIIDSIPKKGIAVIAHRIAWGEERLLADLIAHYDSIGIKTELWNLNEYVWPVVDPRVYKCAVKEHKVIRDNLHVTGKARTESVLSEMSDADNSSVIIVCGIQALQYYPFDPAEMKELMVKLKRIADQRDHPTILFSYIKQLDRKQNEPDRVLTVKELEKIGITEDDAFIIHLDNLYHDPKTGPFFYIDDILLADSAELYESRKQADKLDNPCSHENLFERNIHMVERYERQKRAGTVDNLYYLEEMINRKNHKLDYIDYPRGRVVWDTTRNISIIYIDPCIRNRIHEIVERFSLSEYVVEEDEHYHCRKCVSKELLDT